MNILIITHYIAPIQAVASIRWTKIAKYLKKEHDINITILTDKKNYDDETSGISLSVDDPLLKKDVKYFNEVIEVPYGKGYLYYRKKLYKYKKSKNKNTEYVKNSVNSLNTKKNFKTKLKENESFFRVDFIENRVIASNIYKSIKNVNQYDVIISTFSPSWTHLVAEKIKRKNKNVFWLADFRDSYADDIADCKLAFKYHKNFVKKHCSKADVITRVNDELVLFESKEQKIVTIYNGYDPDEKIQSKAAKKFSFTFTGLMAGDERDFTELFRVVSELIQEGKIDSEDVVFNYAGNSGKLFFEQAKVMNMEKFVIDHGLLKREDALKLQSESLVLLMANANTNTLKCEWSGKMYEYMMTRKPIIYFVSGTVPYSLPSKKIDKLGGCCYEYLRHDEMHTTLKNYIENIYSEWKQEGCVILNCDEEYVNQFAYPHIAKKIWSLISNK